MMAKLEDWAEVIEDIPSSFKLEKESKRSKLMSLANMGKVTIMSNRLR